jgi:TatD DNase family protein
MLITDTHTHLYSDEFEQDRSEMIQRAIDAGVSRFFIPQLIRLLQEYVRTRTQFPENMFLMMGLHPTHVKDNYLEELQCRGGIRNSMPLEK